MTASPFYASKPVDLATFVPDSETKTDTETGSTSQTETKPAPAAGAASNGSKPKAPPPPKWAAKRKPAAATGDMPEPKSESKPELKPEMKTDPKPEKAVEIKRSTDRKSDLDGPGFEDLGLHANLLKTLAAEGYHTPTPIQAQCIPAALEGRDLLGCAQTGTGKTAAFALPVIQRLMTSTKRQNRGPKVQPKHGGNNKSTRYPRALILSPTRELADQIAESVATYGKGTGLHHTVVYGGVPQFRQVKALQRGVDILVATPGRLLDLMEQGRVNLGNIELFVLDEADRMLDMGFIHPIRKIAEAFPAKPQTLLFSATMPGPIARLADTLLSNPERVEVTPIDSAAPLIEQSLYLVDGKYKPELLRHLLDDPAVERAVVFIRTKHGAENLANKLSRSGVTAESIHGNKNQNQRTRALESFRSGHSRVLVATDVAARGLDVDGISHVFNFSIPNEPEAYVHRIGRTGRAGATGKAIAMCARDERGYLHAIERLTKTTIDSTPLPETLGLPDEPPLRRRPAEGWNNSGGGQSGNGGNRRSSKGPRRAPGGGSGRTGGSGAGAKSKSRGHRKGAPPAAGSAKRGQRSKAPRG